MSIGGMLSILTFLFLLQCGCVSVLPLFRFSFRPAADLAQRVSLTELNRRTGSPFLFRANRRTVQLISEVGFNTYDMDLHFGVRESVCPIGSDYLDRCATKWSPSAVEGFCSSRVRVSTGYALPLKLRCMIDSSSSESSSSEEELVRVRAPVAAQVPGIVLCRGAARCTQLLW
ncbi:secreted phosphoprotein 24 [Alosa sapidissima]|uniref:secreted phosphoprotein 24 n=1 Tax=Alosa sapidissima TaxID=34773 RepID=UPI001C08706C|nr:secreted phosphoprotein 24 [Alosa sapidissima]